MNNFDIIKWLIVKAEKDQSKNSTSIHLTLKVFFEKYQMTKVILNIILVLFQ